MCKAYLLAKKLVSDEVKVTEQPFPDSWVATTAPLALGLLTDITTEFVVYREAEGQEILWPIIEQQYKLWCVGRAFGTERNDPNADTKSWFPCEALVRIACRELYRLPRRLFADVEFISFAKSSQITWVSIVLNLFSVILTKSVQVEDVAWQNLLDLKEQETTDRKCLGTENLSLVDESSNEELIDTPFGSGRIDRESKYFYLDPEGGIGTELVVNVVKLDFGATLYQPVEGSLALVEHTSDARQIDTNRIPLEVDGT